MSKKKNVFRVKAKGLYVMNKMMKNTIAAAVSLMISLSSLSVYTGNVYAREAATAVEYREQLVEQNIFPNPDENYSKDTKDNLVFRIYDEYAVLCDCMDTDITEVVIPEEVNGLPVIGSVNEPFGYCRNLKKINVPDSFEHIDWFGLTATSVVIVNPGSDQENHVSTVSEVVISETNPFYTTAHGIVYTKDMKTLIGCPPASDIAEPVISEKAERIGDFAFFDCRNVEKVIIPDNILHINNGAFVSCANLKSIEFPENLVSLSGEMCHGCEKLSDVKFGSKIKTLGSGAFSACSSLEKFDVPETVTYIGYNTFASSPCTENCGGIYYLDNWITGSDEDVQIVNIKEGTIGIAESSFMARKRISYVNIPASVKYINFTLFAQTRSADPAKIFLRCSSIDEKNLSAAGTTTDYYIYDPECDIFDDEKTIPAKYKYREYVPSDDRTGLVIDGKYYDEVDRENDTVIHGFENSSAQKYAEKYNRKFEIIRNVSGDMNADGVLNIADVIQTQKWLMGVYDDCTFDMNAADMNENGKVDVSDLCMIKNRIVCDL